MRRSIGSVILAVSGAGFPLCQLAIRRFGWRGAALVEGVTAGLLVRDVAMIADGVPGRLRPGPARLLRLEAVVAGAAVLSGLGPLADREVRAARQAGWHVPRAELVRRVALGSLFGVHTLRFRIFLEPGSGRRG